MKNASHKEAFGRRQDADFQDGVDVPEHGAAIV